MALMQLDMPASQFKPQWSCHLSVTFQQLNSNIINNWALTIVGKKEPSTSVPANLAKRQFGFDFPKFMFLCVCVCVCVCVCLVAL